MILPRLLFLVRRSLPALLPLATVLLSGAVLRAAPQLGLQSWSCSKLTFEQVVDFAAAHGITQVEIYRGHLGPTDTSEEAARKQVLLAAKGITAYSMGVSTTSADPAANRRLFEFAQRMGMKMIVVEPKDQAAWDNLEALVKEFDIKLAIHNHGAGSVYGDPATVRAILAKRDPRIGVCLDVGWVTQAGFDAAKVFEEYDGRVFDIHFKDKQRVRTGGKETWVDTDLGAGDVNFAGLFAALARAHWDGVMAIELEGEAVAHGPAAPVAQAVEFFQAQLRAAHR